MIYTAPTLARTGRPTPRRAILIGLGSAVLALAQACSFKGAPAAAVAVPPIVGTVAFPEPARSVKTNVGYIAKAATIQLIDPDLARVIGTSFSEADGSFSLGFGSSFVPTAGRAYFLEAFKGLADHQAGHPAVRIRTLIQFMAGSWESVTGQSLVISPATTALSVLASLRGTDKIPPTSLIGSLTAGAPDLTPEPPTPDTFRPVANLSNADFHTTYGMVSTALRADQDPFGVIGLNADQPYLAVAPLLTAAPSGGGNVGDTLTLSGGIFDPDPARNQVQVNGVLAQVTGVVNQDSELTVVIPSGATSGPISVLALGNRYQVPFYLVKPSLAVSIK